MVKYCQMMVDDMANMYDGIKDVERSLNKLIEPIKKVEKNSELTSFRVSQILNQQIDVAKALKDIYIETQNIDDRAGQISFEISRHFRNIEVKEINSEVQNE